MGCAAASALSVVNVRILVTWYPVGLAGGPRWICRSPRREDDLAIVAVGRSVLVIVWHLLADPEARFHDLGPDFYDNRISPDRKKRNHVCQLEALGYKVTLEAAA